MTEEEFEREIDCRFPYADEGHAKDLIDLGLTISTNATFIVLEEICRPPRSAEVTAPKLQDYASYWRSKIEHPLADPILRCARSLIKGQKVPTAEALGIMNAVAEYPDQFGALNIVYFACEDVDEADRKSDEILDRWQVLRASPK